MTETILSFSKYQETRWIQCTLGTFIFGQSQQKTNKILQKT